MVAKLQRLCGTELSVTHTAYFFGGWDGCVHVILWKPRKGGAPVTSLDFEVGGKEGGRRKGKGEGAAAEGYRLHVRPLVLTAPRKTATSGFLCPIITYSN